MIKKAVSRQMVQLAGSHLIGCCLTDVTISLFFEEELSHLRHARLLTAQTKKTVQLD